MKILQTARWFFPHVGGASVRVYNTAKNLTAFGHEVHLLVHNPQSIEQCNLDDAAPLYEEYEGIHVYRLPYFAPTQLYWAATIPLMAKKAIDIIKKEKIDVILSHNPPYLVGTSSWTAARMTHKPLVLNVHDVWGASHYSKLQYTIGAKLQKFCCRRADKIITVSDGLADVLAAETGAKRQNIVAAPNGVECGQTKEDEVEEIRNKWGLRGKNVIFFVGILRKWAGVQYLINAFPEVLKKFPETRLLIVGDGGDRQYLEKAAKNAGVYEKTVFAGSVPYEKVPAHIKVADVCVAPFPSSNVTDRKKLMSPHKVLEYMCAGKAVVASRVGGMENYVADGATGFLFTPEDTKELADKIITLLTNKEMREIFGKEGKRLALEGHSWKKSIKVVEKTLEETLR
jgi:glycosyltransferase involved in cell wall biosynthesis